MLNNIIGRRIGEAYKESSNQEIAKQVMTYYQKNGLWTVEQNESGQHVLQKRYLSADDYEKSIMEINKKGEDGLNEK